MSHLCNDMQVRGCVCAGGGVDSPISLYFATILQCQISVINTMTTCFCIMLCIILCRYYAVDFKVSQHAVTIRQVELLLRTERHWGTARLAVEGMHIHRGIVIQQVLIPRLFLG